MSHEFFAGVFVKSTWHHDLTKHGIQDMKSADDLMKAGQSSGAWPINVNTHPLRTESGLNVPGVGIVAYYQDGPPVCHGTGKAYKPLGVDAWRETIEAAVDAGAVPAGAFALRGGSRILATFQLPIAQQSTRATRAERIAGFLTVLDGLDGETPHIIGASWVDVVCANTLGMAFGSKLASGDVLRAKHSARIVDRAKVMREAMVGAMREGTTIKRAAAMAREVALTPQLGRDVMQALIPVPALESDGSNQAQVTRAQNKQRELAKAAALDVNNEGPTLASLWNAATFLVDRTVDGESRPLKAGDMLDSMLLGERGKRVEAIRQVMIPVIEAQTGETVYMTGPEAASHGIDHGQIGRALIDDMLG